MCSDGTPGIDNSSGQVCCPAACGGCGGSGRGTLDGGAAAGLGSAFCRQHAVVELGGSCGGDEAGTQCIMGYKHMLDDENFWRGAHSGRSSCALHKPLLETSTTRP